MRKGKLRRGDLDSSNVMLSSVVFFLFLWAIALVNVYIRGNFGDLKHPYNSVFPAGVTRFGDYFGPISAYIVADSILTPITYLPSSFLVFHLFARLSSDPWDYVYLYLAVGPFLILLLNRYFNWEKISKFAVLTMVLFSYPSLFALHTGNLEYMIVAICFAAVIHLKREKKFLAGSLIGVAAGIKVFPLIYCLLGLTNKSKKFFYGLLVGIVTPNMLSIIFLPGGVLREGHHSLMKVLDNQIRSYVEYRNLMVDSPASFHYGHSIKNSIDAVFGMGSFQYPWSFLTLIIPILFSYLFILVQRNNPPMFVNLTLLACGICLFPLTSTDYKLLYFLPALYALYDEIFRRGAASRFEQLSLLGIIFIIAPKPYLYVGEDPWSNAQIFGTSIAMTCLLIFLVIKYLPKRKVI